MAEKHQMTKQTATAFYLNGLLVLMGITFGFRYLFSSELLGYHLAAMNMGSWTDVAEQYRLMLMVFLRVAGLGMTTSSLCLAIILIFGFRRQENWARWGFLFIFTAHYIPLLINMIYIKLNTPASPPYIVNIFAIIIAVTAFFLSGDMKRTNDENNLPTGHTS